MSPSDEGLTPEDNPILNNPYDPPGRYWKLDSSGRATEEIRHGRRPSAPYPTVPKTTGRVEEPKVSEIKMHDRINLIRKRVEDWRQGGYPGINGMVARLLSYWRSEEQHGTRPYFCQVTAIETLVWLCDADESTDPHLAKLRAAINSACREHNRDIARYATKMATGTGKTMVMGMIIAWHAFRERGRTDVLIMVPNLTVKDRLGSLLPENSGNVYQKILPRSMKLPEHTRVSIVNYQAFQQRSSLAMPGESVDSKTRRILTAGHEEPDSWKESPPAMLDRVLAEHRGASKITVINDEAHHCYLPDPKAKADISKGSNPREAALWFSTLQHLKDGGRLGTVFDMSATPMFISTKADTDTELFPWVVSDYPLIDAIEAGLTKIPRVPVQDITGNDEPKYRNVYRYVQKNERDLRHDSMHNDVKELLQKLEEKYKIEYERYSRNGKIPVMIVVAYPIDNAKAIYKHLAGYRDGDVWVRGYDMFSNVVDGKPAATPNTILVTSDMDNITDSDWKELAIEQETFFPEGADKKDRIKYIRDVFQTVGQNGKPGEKIRCVVSVNMLTEGWDARTVTHIFGYRAFKSDLLCEQVAGRALRRSSLPAGDLKRGETLPPEYAGIFGIPFSFMLGSGRSKDSKMPWNVYTVRGREEFRVKFPNIRSYEISHETTTVEIDPDRIAPYKPKNYDPNTIIIGLAGKPEKLGDVRAHTAIYRLAENVTKVHNSAGAGKRDFFTSVLNAVHQWLAHKNVECDDPSVLAHEANLGNATKAVWDAVTTKGALVPVRPVFADEHEPAQLRELDTSSVDFDTTKDHKYPPGGGIPAKSEMNAAACDSAQEVKVATILDEHDDIEAWARTYRLGWDIPYLNPKTGGWNRYTPDFVARVRGGAAHLIIEFKGQETEDAKIKKEAIENMWLPAVNASEDPACEGKWRYVYIDNDLRIGVELENAIKEALR